METSSLRALQMGGMLTVKEAAQLLYVHENTVRRWTEQGILKTYRIGPRGDRRFRAEDITRLLRKDNKGIRFDLLKGNGLPKHFAGANA